MDRTRWGGAAAALAVAFVSVVLSGCGPSKTRVLLDQGRYLEVLSTVRGGGVVGRRQRAEALLGLGRHREARRELRLALAVDSTEPRTLLLLAEAEERLGELGASLRALLTVQEQKAPLGAAGRRRLARLLLARAALRLDGKRSIGGMAEARRDLVAARRLQLASKAPEAAPSSRPAAGLVSLAAGGGCGGPAGGLPLALVSKGRCALDTVAARRALRRRYLLLACDAAAVARRLEGGGCLVAALGLWRAVAAETPSDPRWHLQVGRLEASRGRMGAAEVALVRYVFGLPGPHRGRGAVIASHMLSARYPRRAASWALKALSLSPAKDGGSRVAALAILKERLSPRHYGQVLEAEVARFPWLRAHVTIPASRPTSRPHAAPPSSSAPRRPAR